MRVTGFNHAALNADLAQRGVTVTTSSTTSSTTQRRPVTQRRRAFEVPDAWRRRTVSAFAEPAGHQAGDDTVGDLQCPFAATR